MKSKGEKLLNRKISWFCAIVFSIYCFLFTAIYQDTLLESIYDQFSTGRLIYNRYIVASIATITLLLLSLWLNKFSKFYQQCEAFSYLPALVLLAFVTDITPSTFYKNEFSFKWLWLGVFTLVVYFISLWMNRHILSPKIKDIKTATYRLLWKNMLIFTVMFLLTGTISNSNDNFKHEAQVYSYIKTGDYKLALGVARKSLVASRELTAIRCYAMAKNSTLGDMLFEYPQYFGADGLILDSVKTSALSPDSIYAYLGLKPNPGESSLNYFKRVVKTDSIRNPSKIDYYLSALLLDKRLDLFSEELEKYYDTNLELPKYYSEAQFLYSKIMNSDSINRLDEELKQRYNLFLQTESKYDDVIIRSNYLRKEYGNTYWWYYLYGE